MRVDNSVRYSILSAVMFECNFFNNEMGISMANSWSKLMKGMVNSCCIASFSLGIIIWKYYYSFLNYGIDKKPMSWDKE